MNIFCSGIGGIGVSAYAALQNAKGHTVSGSDTVDSEILDDLRSQGIHIYLSQDGSKIPKDCDLFVYSEAIPKDSYERKYATENKIKQKSYAQALGDLSKDYKVIAVAGTHGKSSTVAMAAKVLLDSGLDPTILAGTKLKDLDNRNWRWGKSDIFILEACEYRNSFHNFSPDIVLLTNADGDHFDFFGNKENYQKSFNQFLKLLPSNGIVISHLSDGVSKSLTENLDIDCIDADKFPFPELSTPGIHMQQNAQLVLALGKHLNIDESITNDSLKGYSGCWRRLEKKGTYNFKVTVYDDYGHHPIEIMATLLALKDSYPSSRLICVFEPHTHDRTIALYDDFISAFSQADEVILADIYDVRTECDRQEVDMKNFADDVSRESSVSCLYGGSLKEIEKFLKNNYLKKGDVLVCMGAGTITELADIMVGNE